MKLLDMDRLLVQVGPKCVLLEELNLGGLTMQARSVVTLLQACSSRLQKLRLKNCRSRPIELKSVAVEDGDSDSEPLPSSLSDAKQNQQVPYPCPHPVAVDERVSDLCLDVFQSPIMLDRLAYLSLTRLIPTKLEDDAQLLSKLARWSSKRLHYLGINVLTDLNRLYVDRLLQNLSNVSVHFLRLTYSGAELSKDDQISICSSLLTDSRRALVIARDSEKALDETYITDFSNFCCNSILLNFKLSLDGIN